MAPFSDHVDAFFAEFFALNPLAATAAGMHDHDGAWPDLSDAGRDARLAFAARWATVFEAIPADELDRDQAVDRTLLRLVLDEMRFEDEELRQLAWDPLEWVYVMGGGIFPLLAREFGPLADRLTSIASRLEGLPALVDAARQSLVGTPDGRPVSKFHTETALGQLSGIDELIGDALQEAEAAAPTEPDVAAILDRLRAAAQGGTEAVTRAESILRDEILPRAAGEGRLGPELFAAKMRRTLRDDRLTPARILERASQEADAVRAEMVRLATVMWPTWCPDRPQPADAGELVRGVLDAIAGEHQQPADLLDFCRAELGRIEEFCRARDLVGLTDEPLEIRWTPVFLRAFGGAMLDSPGPLDRGQKSFFAITPIPTEWTAEQAESYLREDNDRMLRVLTIHEAVPGHYLQGAYANLCPSLVRAVFWSGVYAEGWAVYVTQVMIDAGYGADDPALLLTHWKFYLRAAINAIIDVRIHAGETLGGAMNEAEAVELMVAGGFQEEAEARNKYNRARLSSTQLSTYFVGSMALWELERDVRRKLAGERAAEVVERPIPGGFGPTPGFSQRRHLEATMGHGTLAPSLLRGLVLDEA
ncbi:MAG TPA: DUF885 domain-containing protein [Candidatus Limnocylindrales bacterium]|nr:DUF885 domain-containing protein [Candidatus Limnocylindrales bacterium]